MSNVLNLEIRKISTLIQNNELNKASNSIKNLDKNFPDELILNLKGLINLKKNDYQSSIIDFQNAIKINSKYLSAYTNLSLVLEKDNNYNESEKIIREALKIDPKSDALNNSLGYSLFKQDKFNESIIFFKNAIDLNPKNFKAYFNLGNVNFKINKFDESISFFLQAIKINSNVPEVAFHLAESYRSSKDFDKALFYYKLALKENNTWLRKEKINAKILESYLILNKKEEYEKDILSLLKEDPENRRFAATSAFISHQFKIKNKYPFCPDPLDFIYTSNIISYFENFENFNNKLYKEILLQDFLWQPSGKTTRNGYGTIGNLSENNLSNLKLLENCIIDETVKYFDLNKEKEITFIKNWPKNFKIVSWCNRLTREGYNITHIHPGGWISGVVYLKMPKKTIDKESGIEFSLHGDDYHIIDKDIPTKIFRPKVGDIVLFPSSLFHRTIPFSSDEERVCIAFDLCKN